MLLTFRSAELEKFIRVVHTGTEKQTTNQLTKKQGAVGNTSDLPHLMGRSDYTYVTKKTALFRKDQRGPLMTMKTMDLPLSAMTTMELILDDCFGHFHQMALVNMEEEAEQVLTSREVVSDSLV